MSLVLRLIANNENLLLEEDEYKIRSGFVYYYYKSESCNTRINFFKIVNNDWFCLDYKDEMYILEDTNKTDEKRRFFKNETLKGCLKDYAGSYVWNDGKQEISNSLFDMKFIEIEHVTGSISIKSKISFSHCQDLTARQIGQFKKDFMEGSKE